MRYTNGNITRQGERISIEMPTNTSRFFNTAGLVRKSFRTQNLLQKKMILAFSIVLEVKTTHKKKNRGTSQCDVRALARRFQRMLYKLEAGRVS